MWIVSIQIIPIIQFATFPVDIKHLFHIYLSPSCSNVDCNSYSTTVRRCCEFVRWWHYSSTMVKHDNKMVTVHHTFALLLNCHRGTVAHLPDVCGWVVRVIALESRALTIVGSNILRDLRLFHIRKLFS